MNNSQDLVPLGKTDIKITTVGVGAWAWGDRMIWGYGGSSYDDSDIRAAFDVSLANGANWFDTAEVYGLGKSERFLGKFLPSATNEVLIATKFFPFPWRMRKKALLNALKKSLKRLQLSQVDLYQIHMPFGRWSKPDWHMKPCRRTAYPWLPTRWSTAYLTAVSREMVCSLTAWKMTSPSLHTAHWPKAW